MFNLLAELRKNEKTDVNLNDNYKNLDNLMKKVLEWLTGFMSSKTLFVFFAFKVLFLYSTKAYYELI